MRAIVDKAGRVEAVGDGSLAPPSGGQTVEVVDDTLSALRAQLAGLTADQEAYYDGQAFGVRARTLSPQEQASKAARALVVSTAQATVGRNVTALVAGEVRALLICLLYEAGAIDGGGVVLPLNSWLRD